MKAPYIIAETAYSFEGSKTYLMDSINRLPESVSAIKFHLLFNIDDYAASNYKSLTKLLHSWVLTREDWIEIISKAKTKGKDVIILADDLNTVAFLEEHHELVDGVEVHAACVNDIHILDNALIFANEYNKRFYLGISGFEFHELKRIINHIKEYEDLDVMLMYGFQNYPTKLQNLQMNKIAFYRYAFDCEVGYADHTQADLEIKDDVICAAYSSGTNVLEIHYVNTFAEKRTDAITAYDAEHLDNLCEKLEMIRTAFGSFEVELNEGELSYLSFRKVPVFSKDMEEGKVVGEADICFKRVEKASEKHYFLDYKDYIGLRTTHYAVKDSEIKRGDLIE